MKDNKKIFNCGECEFRHDNGNCLPVGGFCTSVPAAYCPLIPRLKKKIRKLKKNSKSDLSFNHIKIVYKNQELTIQELCKRLEIAENEINWLRQCMKAQSDPNAGLILRK